MRQHYNTPTTKPRIGALSPLRRLLRGKPPVLCMENRQYDEWVVCRVGKWRRHLELRRYYRTLGYR